MRNDWLWSGKSPYFTLSFSFQSNVSVKISAGLLRNLCRNLDEKLERFELRDVPVLDEVNCTQKFRLSCAAGHFCVTAVHISEAVL